MDLSRFATTCFFCKRLCLYPDYEFGLDVDKKAWLAKHGDSRKIIGNIGDLQICDHCINDLACLLGERR